MEELNEEEMKGLEGGACPYDSNKEPKIRISTKGNHIRIWTNPTAFRFTLTEFSLSDKGPIRMNKSYNYSKLYDHKPQEWSVSSNRYSFFIRLDEF